ncbi:MAG TPA: DUF362 domain-containing protein [bacterium]|nr:DUF362 domain-containing protein [bacterium]
MSSKVFFASARSRYGNNLTSKLERLFDAVGLGDLIDEKDFVALKMHWGEAGNIAYVPAPLIVTILRKIEKAGGKPFVTDTNTLYKGSRRNAIDNLSTAYANGFAFSNTGVPVIIADGLFGQDFVNVKIDGVHFKECKIASAIYNSQALVSVAHFKGHEATGFGGTLKNIGMGCAASSGKQNQHSDVKPGVKKKLCVGCGTCLKKCPVDAISLNDDKKAVIDKKKCIGCAECTVACRFNAIAINWKTDLKLMNEKMAEYAFAAVKGKTEKSVFFNVIMRISPDCDCFDFNDIPIVPDIGIAVSRDPVAVDQASVDLVNKAPVVPGSALGDSPDCKDKFMTLHNTDWSMQLDHAEKMGLGTRDYTLVEIN